MALRKAREAVSAPALRKITTVSPCHCSVVHIIETLHVGFKGRWHDETPLVSCSTERLS